MPAIPIQGMTESWLQNHVDVQTADEDECLQFMAALRLFGLRVREGVVDDLCNTDYPLPWSHIGDEDAWHTIRRTRTLPLVQQVTTASIVSVFGTNPRPATKAHSYWIEKWNTKWSELGSISDLSPAARRDLEAIAARISSHSDVEFVKPWVGDRLFEGGPVKLQRISWIWEREVQTLPLRAILAVALRGALAERPTEDAWPPGPMRALLRQVIAFVAGVGEVPIVPVGDDVDYPLLAIAEMLEFMATGDKGDLDTLSVLTSHAVMLTSMDDYFAALDLDLGTFPELGQPIDIFEDGPLGPIKSPHVPRPPGQLLTRDSFDWKGS